MQKCYIDIKDVNGDFVQKIPETTIFPINWTDEKTLLEIFIAFDSKVFRNGNTFEGEATNGIKIRMFINQSNEIISAFPIF